MVQNLTSYLKESRPEGFRSVPHYFPSGDYLTYFVSDEPYYAKRLDDVITVYLTFDTHELIGCKVKGVKHILRTAGDFAVRVDGDGIELGFFFFVGAAPDRAGRDPKWYDKLKKLAHIKVDSSQFQTA
jgi:hypothetical protein